MNQPLLLIVDDEAGVRQSLQMVFNKNFRVLEAKSADETLQKVTDEAQLRYVLKNTLLTVLSQAKMGSEIEVDIEKQGCLAISYLREGARLASITHYFNASAPSSADAILPLRMLLAKQLVERNGGRMALEGVSGERDVLRLEFPLA